MKPFEMKPFRESDIPVLTEVMTRAFDHDSMKALGRKGGPPGYDDGAFLTKWALAPNSTAFRIDIDGMPGGCAILWLHPEEERNILGCLFLDVPFQNIGMGLAVWTWLETHYPAKVWEVETPEYSKSNQHFYINQCGFEVYRFENQHGSGMPTVKMHKIRHDAHESKIPIGVHAVRIMEIADCKMVSSGTCMIGDETFNRFDRWMSAQPRRHVPADFLYWNGTGFCWLYQAEMAAQLPDDFPIVDFHGGLYAVVSGVDQKTDMKTVDTVVDDFISQNGFVRDPDRPGLGNVITPPAARKIMGYDQMDYHFAIRPKRKDDLQ